MSTKYRNPAAVARERVVELSSQWNHSLNASGDSSSGSSSSTGKVKPGKGLGNYSTSESEDSSNNSGSEKQTLRDLDKQKGGPSKYAAEEDANLGNPDAEWKSGYAHWDSKNKTQKAGSSMSEDEKAKKTQPKGGRAEKYAREEDDSLKPEDTGAPSKDANKSK